MLEIDKLVQLRSELGFDDKKGVFQLHIILLYNLTVLLFLTHLFNSKCRFKMRHQTAIRVVSELISLPQAAVFPVLILEGHNVITFQYYHSAVRRNL